MKTPSRLLSLALAATAFVSPVGAVTALNDTFSNPADWQYVPAWSKGEVTYGPGGLTVTPLGTVSYQSFAIRYVGPGHYRVSDDAKDAFNWFGHNGPVTYSFTLADLPALSDKSGQLGYSASLVLVCNDTTAYGEPIGKPASVLMLKVEDVGPRPAINNQNQFVAQVLFKTASPNKALDQSQRLIRFANEEPNLMPVPYGTWSMTIEGDSVWVTNPIGQRSKAAKLPDDLVRAHAADTANLYLVVSNNQSPPGPVTISRVTVTPTAR